MRRRSLSNFTKGGEFIGHRYAVWPSAICLGGKERQLDEFLKMGKEKGVRQSSRFFAEAVKMKLKKEDFRKGERLEFLLVIAAVIRTAGSTEPAFLFKNLYFLEIFLLTID